jgi:DNA-damage-inducible protein J
LLFYQAIPHLEESICSPCVKSKRSSYRVGLDMTTFFTMAAKQAVREQALPFKPDMNETPNIETLKAMAETEYLINHPEVRKTYDDVDKMMEDILG